MLIVYNFILVDTELLKSYQRWYFFIELSGSNFNCGAFNLDEIYESSK